jgi:DNA-binding response OmpR family regulator
LSSETRTTVAILSGCRVVGRGLTLLLESAGYEVRLLEEPDGSEVEDLLRGVDVLLLGRGLGEDHREEFLRAMTSTLETATIPVLSLSASPGGTLFKEDRVVPWPCRIEDLAREIEAALRRAAVDQT